MEQAKRQTDGAENTGTFEPATSIAMMVKLLQRRR